MYFPNMTQYGHALAQEPGLCLGVIKLTILADSSLGIIIIIYSVFGWSMPRSREKDIFKKYINCTNPTIIFNWGWGGCLDTNNFLSPHPTDATY